MGEINELPKLLVIDDMYGRALSNGPNPDRVTLCRNLGLRDVTGDDSSGQSANVKNPVAEAVFCRGQTPAKARPGDVVENDLDGTLKLVRSGWDQKPPGNAPWALVLLDLCFYTGNVTSDSESAPGLGPGMPEGHKEDSDPKKYFGLKVLNAIQEQVDQEMPVVILSSMDSKEIEREWVKGGAVRFIERNAENASEALQETLDAVGVFPDFEGKVIGCSLPLLKLLRSARQIRDDEHVLLLGETGTGKQVLADYINRQARKRDPNRPYIERELQQIPQDFIATELFGYKKGSGIAGATKDKEGAFKRADGGDLFLDEIGYATSEVQARLLRVLQSGYIEPLGATKPEKVDVRVIFATDSKPELLLPQLLNRINRVLKCPPLNERKDDIAMFAEWILQTKKEEGIASKEKSIDPEVIERLLTYDWKDKNVRVLINTIINAVQERQFAPIVTENDLPVEFVANRQEAERLEMLSDEETSEANSSTVSQQFRSDPEFYLPSGLSESLPELQHAIMKYLDALLEETRDITLDKDKQLSGTRAYKLMLPKKERKLKKNHTVNGAAIFKKLLHIHPETTSRSLGEYPALSEVWEWVETRGGGSKKKKKRARK